MYCNLHGNGEKLITQKKYSKLLMHDKLEKKLSKYFSEVRGILFNEDR